MNTRPSNTVRTTDKGGGNRGFVIALVLAVVAAIVVGGILLSGGGDEEAEPTPVEGVGDGGATTTVAEFGQVTVTGDTLDRYQPDVEDPAIGLPAPVLEGKDFSGNPVTIGGPSNSPTMVLFLAHWCPHCNAEVDRLAQYLADNGAPEGVRIALVTTGSDPSAPNWPPSQWLKDKKVSGFDVIADSEVQTAAVAYGLSSYPYIIELAPDGTVLSRMSGEQSEGFFDAAFSALASVG